MTNGPNRVLAILVGLIVLLAVVSAIVVANRPTPVLDQGTPEGVVQAFLQALADEDFAAAADHLAASSACVEAELLHVPTSSRIVLDRAVVTGDRAVVTLRVTEGSSGDPFEGSGWTRDERITLEREDGAWKVAASPWLLYPCGENPEGVRT